MAKKRGNGEGSISRRKNGGWMAQYAVYTAEGRKRKTLYGKTRAAVAEKLTKAMADRDGGLIFDAGSLTIGAYTESAYTVAQRLRHTASASLMHFPPVFKTVSDQADSVLPRSMARQLC